MNRTGLLAVSTLMALSNQLFSFSVPEETPAPGRVPFQEFLAGGGDYTVPVLNNPISLGVMGRSATDFQTLTQDGFPLSLGEIFGVTLNKSLFGALVGSYQFSGQNVPFAYLSYPRGELLRLPTSGDSFPVLGQFVSVSMNQNRLGVIGGIDQTGAGAPYASLVYGSGCVKNFPLSVSVGAIQGVTINDRGRGYLVGSKSVDPYAVFFDFENYVEISLPSGGRLRQAAINNFDQGILVGAQAMVPYAVSTLGSTVVGSYNYLNPSGRSGEFSTAALNRFGYGVVGGFFTVMEDSGYPMPIAFLVDSSLNLTALPLSGEAFPLKGSVLSVDMNDNRRGLLSIWDQTTSLHYPYAMTFSATGETRFLPLGIQYGRISSMAISQLDFGVMGGYETDNMNQNKIPYLALIAPNGTVTRLPNGAGPFTLPLFGEINSVDIVDFAGEIVPRYVGGFQNVFCLTRAFLSNGEQHIRYRHKEAKWETARQRGEAKRSAVYKLRGTKGWSRILSQKGAMLHNERRQIEGREVALHARRKTLEKLVQMDQQKRKNPIQGKYLEMSVEQTQVLAKEVTIGQEELSQRKENLEQRQAIFEQQNSVLSESKAIEERQQTEVGDRLASLQGEAQSLEQKQESLQQQGDRLEQQNISNQEAANQNRSNLLKELRSALEEQKSTLTGSAELKIAKEQMGQLEQSEKELRIDQTNLLQTTHERQQLKFERNPTSLIPIIEKEELNLVADAGDNGVGWVRGNRDPNALFSIWLSPFGSYIQLKKEHHIPSSQNAVGGTLLCLDYYPDRFTTFGGGFGYAFDYARYSHSAGHSKINEEMALLYASFVRGSFFVNTSLWGGIYPLGNRSDQFSGLFSGKARTGWWVLNPHLEMSYFPYETWFSLEMFAMVDWINNWERSYTEKSASGFALKVPNLYASLLRSEAGLRFYESLQYNWGVFLLQQKTSYVRTNPFGDTTANTNFVGSTAQFGVSVNSSKVENLVAGELKASFLPKNSTSPYGSLTLQAEIGSRYQSYFGSVEIGRSF